MKELIDEIAIEAMKLLVINFEINITYERLAEKSYNLAKCMVEERKKHICEKNAKCPECGKI